MKETVKNLSKAFVGESQARNRYTLYAKTAKKEGFEKIAEVFLTTAEQERQHAKWLFTMINDLKKDGDVPNEVTIEAEVPNMIGTTAENLKAAIAGENYEHTDMYPEFAAKAREEGLDDIANRLEAISKAEEHHEERYTKILKEVEGGTFFKKEEEVEWVCRECGYVHKGTTPPELCPSCDHPKAFYELKCETY
jgi:rubrerythrin